jgi:acyl-CoA synthetase (AMP-forming)/AMP-acid ligase II
MPGGKTLAQILYSGAEIDPTATAVETFDGNITFKELIGRVAAMGGALRKRASVPRGRIALCAGNSVDHLVTYLAILLSGFIWVPLNPANGRALNSRIVEKAKPDLLLVDRASSKQAPENNELMQLDTLQPAPRSFEATQASPDDVAAIKFTGGTSGEPKGVIQTHGNMLAVIENLHAFYEFNKADCNLVVAPLTHGSSHYIFPVLGAGGRHLFPKDRAAATILSAMQKGVTIAFMPPTLIYKLLQSNGLSPGRFAGLRHLTYSAAPMPPEKIAEAQLAFGSCVSSLYGQTEAPMSICALTTEEMQDPVLRGKAGKACWNSEVRIVDESGKGLPPGEIGHVEVRGPIVMREYLDEPELTAAAMHDGWLCTGDLGWLDDSGILTLAGRASEVIITGGFNVYPAEIENVLAKTPGVRECCVYGVEDPYWGERIEAAIVPDTDSETIKDEILAFIKCELGPVRMPKALHVVDALPRNAVGKVVRRELHEYIRTRRETSDVGSL